MAAVRVAVMWNPDGTTGALARGRNARAEPSARARWLYRRAVARINVRMDARIAVVTTFSLATAVLLPREEAWLLVASVQMPAPTKTSPASRSNTPATQDESAIPTNPDAISNEPSWLGSSWMSRWSAASSHSPTAVTIQRNSVQRASTTTPTTYLRLSERFHCPRNLPLIRRPACWPAAAVAEGRSVG